MVHLFYLFTFLQIISLSQCAKNLAVNCTALRNTFADYNSKFTQCVIYYSRPIKLCEGCVDDYLNVLSSYRNLSLFVDDHGACINNFVDKDRLQTLNRVFTSTVDLWNSAKCYECFESVNNTFTAKKSNETVRFEELHGNLMSCLNGSGINETTMCSSCLDSYVALNNFYYSISNENEKIGVCMDIVDQMNTTRSFWSDNCCKYRRKSEYVFLGTTTISFAIAALFYFLTKVCTDIKVATILPQNRFFGSVNIRDT